MDRNMWAIGFVACLLPAFAGAEEVVTDTIPEEHNVILSEVTVQSASVVKRSDGSYAFYPDSRQRSSAADGIGLLQRMMIPNLVVNAVSGEVKTTTRKPVTLMIDGREASQQDISALRPKDVLRVEYYEQPTGKFLANTAVVNYVMRKYEYGGYVYLQGTQRFFYDTGVYGASAKFDRKKWSVQVMGGGRYEHDGDVGSDMYETFRFPGDPMMAEAKRSSTVADGFLKSWQGYGVADVNYTDSLTTFETQVGLFKKDTPEDWSESVMRYSYRQDDSRSRTQSTQSSLMPYWTGYIRRLLPNGQSLLAHSQFKYSRAHSSRLYGLSDEGFEPVGNFVEADNFQFGLRLKYEKTFKQGNSITAYASTAENWYNNHYSGTVDSEQQLLATESTMGITYSHVFKKRWQVKWQLLGTVSSHHVNELERVVNFSPNPAMLLSYQINDRHSLNANVEWTQFAPTTSQLNDVDQPLDELLTLRGNPGLDVSQCGEATLSYTALFGDLSLNASFYWTGSFDCILATWYPEGEKMIQTYVNNGNCHFMSMGISPSWSLFNKSLMLQGSLYYSPQYRTGIRKRYVDCVVYNLRADWYYRQFTLSAYYDSKFININTQGTEYTLPGSYGLTATCRYKQWLFSVFYESTDKPDYKQEMWSPHYDYLLLHHSDYARHKVGVTVTCSFDFGRKVARRDLQVDKNVNSAILK